MALSTLLLSPFGRIDRTTFWASWLGVAVVTMMLGWIPFFGWALCLAALYVHVCLFSKRLHDMGRSGWWQVVPTLAFPVLILGGLISLSGAELVMVAGDRLAVRGGLGAEPMVGATLLALAIGPAFFLWIGLTPGRAAQPSPSLQDA